MGIAMLFLFLGIVLYRYATGKVTIGYILGWMIISPVIRIGNIEMDSTYLVIIVLFLAILIIKGKIALAPRRIQGYLCMLLLINLIYVISWLLFNRNDPRTMFSSFFGALKNVLILWECFELNRKNWGNLNMEIATMLEVVAIINLLFVLFQMTFFNESINIMKQILSKNEISYLAMITQRGYYSRYFGILGYPMRLGMVCAYSLAFFAFLDKRKVTGKKIVVYIVEVILGICSASKTFILGTAIIVVLWWVNAAMRSNQNKRYLVMSAIGVILMASIYLFYDAIFQMIYSIFGSTFAYYFSILKNVGDIFYSRFNASDGTLATGNLFTVIKQNIFFGVGISPLMGESVMDNAPLIILHNGGLLCLLIVLSFYLRLILKNINKPAYIAVILIILATGMGFETWTSEISSFLILIIMMESSTDKKYRNPIQKHNVGCM